MPQLNVNNTGGNSTGIGELGNAEFKMAFANLPGTQGSLVALNPPDGLDIEISDGVPGFATFYENRNDFEKEFLQPYDPTEFLFTTLDGRQFQFNGAGKVVKMTDRNGNTLTIDQNGVTHSSGKGVKFVRDGSGRITQIYDPNGLDGSGQPSGPAALIYKYDPMHGNLISAQRLSDRTDPAHSVYLKTTFVYGNPKYPNYITAIQDPRGVTAIRNNYGADGRLTSNTDADGKTITYVHDINGRQETIVDRLGNTNVFSYDTKGNVTNSVDGLGRRTSRTYDQNNNLISVTDPLTNTYYFTYDSQRNQTSSLDPLNHTNSTTYNAFGQPLTMTDALGNITRYAYDNRGNQTNTVDALGNSQSVVYDLGGNPVMSIDALNRTNVTAGFDSSGNMITLSNVASGVLTQFNYDSNGNRTGSSNRWVNPNDPSDVHSITNLHVFDAQNREISRSDSNGKQSAVAYNEVGAQSQITDEYGKITGWMYDSRGNLIQIAHSDGTISQMVYDDENRLTVTDDNHQPGSIANGTRITLDAAGQVTKSERLTNVTINILPDGVASRSVLASFAGVIGTTTYGYDLAGRQITVTNAFGSVTRYEFDKAGHQTAVIDALNNRTDYAFDAAGRLIATTNALGRVTRTEYDPLGRPVRTIYPDGTSSGTAYNALGQRLSETNQLGLVTDFEYASSGNLTAIVKPQVFDPEGGTNARPRFEFDYDSYAQLAVARDPKRHETRFTNDFLGRAVARTLPL